MQGMSRELGGWAYSDLWASAAMMQQQQQQQQLGVLSPPAYGSGGLAFGGMDAAAMLPSSYPGVQR